MHRAIATRRFTKILKIDIGEKKDSFFNRLRMSACKRMELDPCLSPCTQINFKYIKDLNTGLKPLKLAKEKVEETLQETPSGRTF